MTIGLSSEPGVFYTLEKSSDMKNWVSLQTVFAASATLAWTDVVSAAGAEFVRAKVNRPNTTAVTNYAAWTNTVL